MLRRPHNLRRDPGEQVDEHASCGGGEEANADRGEDPQVVLERLVRAQDREPRQAEGLAVRKHPCAEPLFLGLRPLRQREPQQPHQDAYEQINGVLERRGDLTEQHVARDAAADPAEEGKDQQPRDRVAPVVRGVAGDEHAVQAVDAG